MHLCLPNRYANTFCFSFNWACLLSTENFVVQYSKKKKKEKKFTISFHLIIAPMWIHLYGMQLIFLQHHTHKKNHTFSLSSLWINMWHLEEQGWWKRSVHLKVPKESWGCVCEWGECLGWGAEKIREGGGGIIVCAQFPDSLSPCAVALGNTWGDMGAEGSSGETACHLAELSATQALWAACRTTTQKRCSSLVRLSPPHWQHRRSVNSFFLTWQLSLLFFKDDVYITITLGAPLMLIPHCMTNRFDWEHFFFFFFRTNNIHFIAKSESKKWLTEINVKDVCVLHLAGTQ